MRNKYNMTSAKFSSIYKEYHESGISIKEYCSNMCYHKSSFYDWLKKYPNVVDNYVQGNALTGTPTPTVTLSPLVIVDEAVASPNKDSSSNYRTCISANSRLSKKRPGTRNKKFISQKIEIIHPSGLSIKLSGSLNPQLLESILKHF